MRLLLVTLNKHKRPVPTKFQSFTEMIVCDQNSEDCMLGTRLYVRLYVSFLLPKNSRKLSGINW